jgi:hypothetical protein
VRARPLLATRVEAAHAAGGRGRPPATPVAFGELGAGDRRAYTFELRRGRCYSIVVVAASDDSDLAGALFDGGGRPVARGAGSAFVLEVCPPAGGRYRLEVVMERGSGPFALRIHGS